MTELICTLREPYMRWIITRIITLLCLFSSIIRLKSIYAHNSVISWCVKLIIFDFKRPLRLFRVDHCMIYIIFTFYFTVIDSNDGELLFSNLRVFTDEIEKGFIKNTRLKFGQVNTRLHMKSYFVLQLYFFKTAKSQESRKWLTTTFGIVLFSIFLGYQ